MIPEPGAVVGDTGGFRMYRGLQVKWTFKSSQISLYMMNRNLKGAVVHYLEAGGSLVLPNSSLPNLSADLPSPPRRTTIDFISSKQGLLPLMQIRIQGKEV